MTQDAGPPGSLSIQRRSNPRSTPPTAARARLEYDRTVGSASTWLRADAAVDDLRRSAAAAATEHVPALDGVRGIAALMVLFFHLFYWSMRHEAWTGVARLVSQATAPGFLGVDLFFVLSGFLITRILLRSRGRTDYYRSFYARRLLRIAPLYYAVLAVVWLAYAGSGSFVSFSAVFLSNVALLFGIGMPLAVLWSLSIEEHFYVVWPLVVRCVGPRGLIGIAVAIVLAEPLVRAWGLGRDLNVYYQTWFRLDGIAAGALLALVSEHYRLSARGLRRYALAALVAGTATALAASAIPASMRDAVTLYTVPQLFFVAFVAAAVASRDGGFARVLSGAWLVHCGRLSYCLYLVHMLVLDAWDVHVGPTLPHVAALDPFGRVVLRAAVVGGVSLAIAEASRRARPPDRARCPSTPTPSDGSESSTSQRATRCRSCSCRSSSRCATA